MRGLYVWWFAVIFDVWEFTFIFAKHYGESIIWILTFHIKTFIWEIYLFLYFA